MRVLSLFDGISGGYIALDRLGIEPASYYASEIERVANDISRYWWPKIKRLGDVRDIDSGELGSIDLIIGGSPCTNLSFAGNQEGLMSSSLTDYLELKNSGYKFKGQSFLFWEYIRLLMEIKPKYFLLENVRMKSEHRAVIDNILGKPIFIESANFSGAMRKRYYWTNISVETVEHSDYRELVPNYNGNKNVLIEDVWAGGLDITERYRDKIGKTRLQTLGPEKCGKGRENEPALTWKKALANTRSLQSKAKCLTAAGQGISNAGATNIPIGDKYYTLDSLTAERLMTLPDNYTRYGKSESGEVYEVKEGARHSVIGNGWTIDVICELLKPLS